MQARLPPEEGNYLTCVETNDKLMIPELLPTIVFKF
jgi:hypothetical protein